MDMFMQYEVLSRRVIYNRRMRIHRRLLALSLLLPLTAASADVSAKAKPKLRFDGIYEEYPAIVDSNDYEHRWYLRFYEDGTVVEKEAVTPPEKWSSKLERENEKLEKTSYKLDGDRLAYAFETEGDRNTSFKRVEGIVLPGGKLRLTITKGGTFESYTTGNTVSERTFAFMKPKAAKK